MRQSLPLLLAVRIVYDPALAHLLLRRSRMPVVVVRSSAVVCVVRAARLDGAARRKAIIVISLHVTVGERERHRIGVPGPDFPLEPIVDPPTYALTAVKVFRQVSIGERDRIGRARDAGLRQDRIVAIDKAVRSVPKVHSKKPQVGRVRHVPEVSGWNTARASCPQILK